MKAIEISVAGKTFMAGEYLALTGGPALVLATEPRFRLLIQEGKSAHNPFHPHSPAGQFWESQKDFFSRYEMNFQAPHQVGGFGASSAQFALLHSFWQIKEEAFGESQRFFDWHHMLNVYRGLPTEGKSPSGADVMGAVSGGITWFDRNNGKLQTFAWPFQETEFFVAHTGEKLATHEHLKSLGSFETYGFQKAMHDVHQGLSLVNFATFLEGMKSYRSELERQGLVAEHTKNKILNLEGHSEILFMKGCGAMGSDVILAFCKKEDSNRVRQLLQSQELQVMADSSKIASGLQVRNLNHSLKEVSL